MKFGLNVISRTMTVKGEVLLSMLKYFFFLSKVNMPILIVSKPFVDGLIIEINMSTSGSTNDYLSKLHCKNAFTELLQKKN